MPVALAVIVAEPTAAPVTVTVALVAPAATLIVAGTVTLLASLEIKLTVNPPAGARPPLRLNARVPVRPMRIDSGAPVKAIVGAATVTAPLPGV
jgi:hypothetical protein